MTIESKIGVQAGAASAPGVPLDSSAFSERQFDPKRLAQMITVIAVSRPREAEPLVDEALKRFPRSAELNAVAGELALERNDVELAELYFLEARILAPSNPSAAVGLATIQLSRGEFAVALESLRPALQAEVSLSPQVVWILDTLCARGVGAQELLDLTSIRSAEVERLTSGETVGDLHRKAKQALGLGVVDVGPGVYARSTVDRIVNSNALPIDRTAWRVAPREKPEPGK